MTEPGAAGSTDAAADVPVVDWGPFTIAGRRCVVTGGAKGIGFGVAARLA